VCTNKYLFSQNTLNSPTALYEYLLNKGVLHDVLKILKGELQKVCQMILKLLNFQVELHVYARTRGIIESCEVNINLLNQFNILRNEYLGLNYVLYINVFYYIIQENNQ